MCTIGPCKFHIEEFTCSSKSCKARIMSEGLESCVFIEKVSNAATHALMRRELCGVAVSNGTLTVRLKHFHSLVTANAYFGLIPPAPFCRSNRSLIKTCSLMLRLMSPPSELFRCLKCELHGQDRKERLNALCMDGISHGFVKTGLKAFYNSSEQWKALKSLAHLTKRAQRVSDEAFYLSGARSEAGNNPYKGRNRKETIIQLRKRKGFRNRSADGLRKHISAVVLRFKLCLREKKR